MDEWLLVSNHNLLFLYVSGYSLAPLYDAKPFMQRKLLSLEDKGTFSSICLLQRNILCFFSFKLTEKLSIVLHIVII